MLLPAMLNTQSAIAIIPALLSPVFPIMVTYAIIRHRLWDIRTVVHKTAAWIALLLIAMTPIYGLAWGVLSLAGKVSRGDHLFLVILVFWAGYAYMRLVKPPIDHLFQRRAYDRQKVLKKLGEDMCNLQATRDVATQLLDAIADALYPERIAILLKRETGDDAEEQASGPSVTWRKFEHYRGKMKVGSVSMRQEDPAIKQLVDIGAAVELSQIASDEMFEGAREAVKAYFKQHNIHVCLVLLRGKSLIGMIHLEEKRNLQPYSRGDLEFLEDLRVSAMVGLSNALLFEKVDLQRQALAASQEQLQRLGERLAEVKEEESARIARELHDELGQLLTSIKIDAAILERNLTSDATVGPGTEQRARTIAEVATKSIGTVQRITKELRPSMLDGIGLVPTIEWMVSEFAKRTDVHVAFNGHVKRPDLDRSLATAIYRIIQESLTNVARHAKATKVIIDLEEREGAICATVQDNGIGITEAQKTHHDAIGLLGMAERARPFGGTVAITGVSGGGTTVALRIPVGDLSLQ
ncbi:MAG: sensor histidine kinase [Myxococcota bacterium]|nr:sensor histidine kinase [Myxococcota bacterium]